jgi:hypothetical protein
MTCSLREALFPFTIIANTCKSIDSANGATPLDEIRNSFVDLGVESSDTADGVVWRLKLLASH